MPATRPFNLRPFAALLEMKDILRVMQGETDREQLKDVDPDTAFERGYQTAILDYEALTGPRPSATRLWGTP